MCEIVALERLLPAFAKMDSLFGVCDLRKSCKKCRFSENAGHRKGCCWSFVKATVDSWRLCMCV